MAPPGGFCVAATPDARVPYALLDPDGEPVEPVEDYLAELLASDYSPLTLKSYAFDLQDWFRFLAAAGMGWEQATRKHVRDWVLALRSRHNPQHQRRADRPAAGSVNPRTGKPSLRPGYAPATIKHRLSVVAAFYAYQGGAGRGPARNPVPNDGPSASGRNAHHSPMEPWRAARRGSYRQKTEQRT